jgi:hemolysin D
MSIRAPTDGTINRLSINTIGAAVNTGQLIATIVPSGEELEVLIAINSRDMGFVSAGEDVMIKVDAFPYTRFGFIRSKLSRISREAILGGELTSAELIESGARQIDPQDPFRRFFVGRLSVRPAESSNSGLKLELTPGMTVVADIITGERKVYEYLFTSLLERTREFARER